MNQQKISRALIVAAGAGLRLRPYTNRLPKALLEVAGIPLIRRSIDILSSYGVTDVTAVVGYEHEKIQRLLGDSVGYIINHDFGTTNNMASFFMARQLLEDHPFLYLHSDLWYDPLIIGRALNHPGAICLMVENKQCGEEEMKVRVENGLVTEADKSIPSSEAFGEWLGISKFLPEGGSAFFQEMEKTLQQSRSLYDCAVVRNLALHGVPMHCVDIGKLPWVEIDFEEDLKNANLLAQQVNAGVPLDGLDHGGQDLTRATGGC